jgi:hypothetical protein
VLLRHCAPVLLTLVSALGCVHVQPITTDRPLELKPDQGILVLHVENDVPIRRLRLNKRIDATRRLSEGTHLELVILPTGNYRWTTIELVGFGGYYYIFDLPSDPEWSFEVKPGHINYPGQIVVENATDEVYSRGRAWRWTKNRSAVALDELLEKFPKLMAAHPLSNARAERDDFLAHYQKVAPNELSPSRQGKSQ